jgi:hypothetical protein
MVLAPRYQPVSVRSGMFVGRGLNTRCQTARYATYSHGPYELRYVSPGHDDLIGIKRNFFQSSGSSILRRVRMDHGFLMRTGASRSAVGRMVSGNGQRLSQDADCLRDTARGPAGAVKTLYHLWILTDPSGWPDFDKTPIFEGRFAIGAARELC